MLGPLGFISNKSIGLQGGFDAKSRCAFGFLLGEVDLVERTYRTQHYLAEGLIATPAVAQGAEIQLSQFLELRDCRLKQV
ncbi:MAG: hypothetical protein AAF989_12605, partial [Planctomycetota bacterium]